MALQSGASTSSNTTQRDDGFEDILEPKHKVFLSHSGFQKPFVEHLCLELEGCFRYPFFDNRSESLRIGDNIPQHIFDAIRHCNIGLVILSEEFLTSKWPMMELAAMYSWVLEEEGKEKSNFKIIPVFLHTLPKEFDDPANWRRWRSCWQELAMKYPKRVQVEKWEAALKYLRPVKGPVYNGLDEIGFQNEIVDEICGLVPPQIKLEDSHIQGRFCLCKVIWDKIGMLQNNANNGICILGLYGMGGVGKTTICKALCNEFFTRFRGRVCHAELEKGSEKELLQELLKSLTNMSHARIAGFNVDQMRFGLKEGLIKNPVFLALDNMSDSDESIKQVKSYLLARLPAGSIVMMTARSKDWLTRVRPHIDESKCLEMPELEEEEAKSLFAKSSDFELRNDINDELILRCVQQCHFWKNDGSGGRHYHPLALDVLGKQLARLNDPKEWASDLDRIDEDIFNHSEENNHPVFSILRSSFDTLSARDQLLFMDVALFLPTSLYQACWNVFEWLRIVHRMPRVGDVKRALERLTAKSVLVRVGDGVGTNIGVHELWRSFCISETKYGELRRRRWMYNAVNSMDLELVESGPSGTCWENMQRMAFVDEKLEGLKTVKFAHFSNVTVLKIWGYSHIKKLVVDLSELIHLKSLEVWEKLPLNCLFIVIPPLVNRLVLRGLPKNLVFLRLMWEYVEVFSLQELMMEIACLTELQYLHLDSFGGSELPDMRSMVSLHVAIFKNCVNVVTVTGLSSELTLLRILDLRGCRKLSSCPGVGDLVFLEELNCRDCIWLWELPDLQKLRYLRELDITHCNLIGELPGLGDLVALEKLNADRDGSLQISKFMNLPDMSKLRKLRVLNLLRVHLVAVSGVDSLISLRTMVANFQNVEEKPTLQQLTNLHYLGIGGLSLAGLRGLDNLVMLDGLEIAACSDDADELPEFRSLTGLQFLGLSNSEFKDVSSLRNLITLERLIIAGCQKLERLPDLRRLTRLKLLQIQECAMLRDWDCPWGSQVEVPSCRSGGTTVPIGLPDSQRLKGSLTLSHETCENVAVDATSNGALLQLETLDCSELPILEELPDLSNFPRLESLVLRECLRLRRLTSHETMNALSVLTLSECTSLATLPDLCKFPVLRKLGLSRCEGITTLSSSVALSALQELSLEGCSGVKELPDLGMFPALETLGLQGCSSLTTLSSSVASSALQELSLKGCSGVRDLPDLGIFPALKTLGLEGCSSLTTLSSSVASCALQELSLEGCSGVKDLPDLGMFPALETLGLQGCSSLTTLSSSVASSALQELSLKGCSGVKDLPDLGIFPALKTLGLKGCSSLTTLSTSMPMPTLRSIDATGCWNLSRNDLDQLQASCIKRCSIKIADDGDDDDVDDGGGSLSGGEVGDPAVFAFVVIED